MTMRSRSPLARCLLLPVVFLGSLAPALAQEEPTAASQPAARSAWVYLRGKQLFEIRYPIGPYSPADRAAVVSSRLEALAADPAFDVETITSRPTEWGYEIVAGDVRLASLIEEDARRSGATLEALTARAVAVLKRELGLARAEFTPDAIWGSVRSAGLATLALVAFVVMATLLRPRLASLLRALEQRVVGEGATATQRTLVVARHSLAHLLRLAGFLAFVAAIVAWLLYVLVELPWTRPAGRRLLPWTLGPLQEIGQAIADYFPNLVYVVAISLVAHVLLRFLRLFFDEIGRGTIRLGSFEPEWAASTFRIVRFFVLAFALVAMFPYLPGSGSEAFKGISLMVGVLVSLGSTSAVSNIIAGLMLQYTRAFRSGDLVKMGEATGVVLETRLMTTRLLTLRNEHVSIPNGMVLGGQVVNYSAAADRGGLVLQTTVTIGYDVPWRKVEALLLDAARRTGGIRSDPAPVVLQTGLGDYSVAYELGVHLEAALSMRTTLSALHAAIQDAFAEAGVEILSPAYAALRDGNVATLPTDDVETPAGTPAFRVRVTGADEAG